MPNDEGFLKRKYREFVLQKDLVTVDATDKVESNDLPYMDRLPYKLLPEYIAKASG